MQLILAKNRHRLEYWAMVHRGNLVISNQAAIHWTLGSLGRWRVHQITEDIVTAAPGPGHHDGDLGWTPHYLRSWVNAHDYIDYPLPVADKKTGFCQENSQGAQNYKHVSEKKWTFTHGYNITDFLSIPTNQRHFIWGCWCQRMDKTTFSLSPCLTPNDLIMG